MPEKPTAIGLSAVDSPSDQVAAARGVLQSLGRKFNALLGWTGDAASKSVGVAPGQIPIIGSDGKLPAAVLSELGGGGFIGSTAFSSSLAAWQPPLNVRFILWILVGGGGSGAVNTNRNGRYGPYYGARDGGGAGITFAVTGAGGSLAQLRLLLDGEAKRQDWLELNTAETGIDGVARALFFG